MKYTAADTRYDKMKYYPAGESGKALYAGLSNYDGERLAWASAILRELNQDLRVF